MREKKITFSWLFFSLLALAACSRLSNGPTIHANLYARYDDASHVLKAEAAFKEGDTLETARPISIQGGVSFANSAMVMKNLPGAIRYDYELGSGTLPAEMAFNLKDKNDKEFTFPLIIEPVKDFSFPDTILSKKSTLKIQVKTAALTAGSKLVILVSDEKNESLTAEFKGVTPDPVIEIPAARLQAFTPGKLQVSLVRTDYASDKAGRFELTKTAEFYSATKFLKLTD